MSVEIDVNTSVEFYVCCDECGYELSAEYKTKDGILFVEPCEYCINKAVENEKEKNI